MWDTFARPRRPQSLPSTALNAQKKDKLPRIGGVRFGAGFRLTPKNRPRNDDSFTPSAAKRVALGPPDMSSPRAVTPNIMNPINTVILQKLDLQPAFHDGRLKKTHKGRSSDATRKRKKRCRWTKYCENPFLSQMITAVKAVRLQHKSKKDACEESSNDRAKRIPIRSLYRYVDFSYDENDHLFYIPPNRGDKESPTLAPIAEPGCRRQASLSPRPSSQRTPARAVNPSYDNDVADLDFSDLLISPVPLLSKYPRLDSSLPVSPCSDVANRPVKLDPLHVGRCHSSQLDFSHEPFADTPISPTYCHYDELDSDEDLLSHVLFEPDDDDDEIFHFSP